MSAGTLIQAFEEYQGAVYDLTRRQRVSGDSLRGRCDALLRQAWIRHLQCGEPIILSLPNGPTFYSALIALLKIGSSPILMHGDSTATEISRMAENYGVRFALIRADGEHAANATRVRLENFDGMEDCFLWQVADRDARSLASLSGVCLHPTSGTTGYPKLAVRPDPCAVAEATHYIETIGDIGANDTILCTTPLSHAYAYGLCFAVSLLTSANVVTMAQFSPRLALRAIGEQKVTLLQAVPAMYDVFLRVWPGGTAVPRHAFSAGAPLGKESTRRFSESSGIAIRSLYGTTETGGISISAGSSIDDVGRPMNGVEISLRAVDEKTFGKALGVLRVRSSSMMTGYLRENGIDDTSINEGWFETGDLAEIDSRGTIHLRGRETEFISVFGMKVDPVEVENAIASHEKVGEVKVYRGAHSTGSEAVFASVVPLNGFADAEEIRRHCLKQLAAYKIPNRIHFLTALPRSPSGKILCGELPGSLRMQTPP